MVSSRKVLICLLVILSFSALSLSQTSGQKTKPNKDSNPALKPPTLPKSSIEMDLDSELGSESDSDSDSDPILPLELDIASKPSMPPGSGPKPTPKPGTQQKLTPQASPVSASDPRSTTHPKAFMASSPDTDSETELPTEPDDDPKLNSKPNPSPVASSKPNPSPVASSKPKPTPPPSSKPKPTPEQGPKPTESDDDPISATKPSTEQKPATKSAPNPKEGSKSSPQPTLPTEKTLPTPTTIPTLPYQTVNNFCLYKRLNVNRIFCLKVLKNPKAANATANDYNPLLQVATKATTCHVIKTLKYLKTLYKDKKTDPALKQSIRECVIAYQEIAGYIKLVLADAIQGSAIAGLDDEVIVEDINRCVRAMPKIKNNEVGERNQIAKNYAKLLGDIADNP